MHKQWCHDHKTWTSDNQTTGNAWYGQVSRPSHCSLLQEESTSGKHPRKPTIWNAWFQQWNTGIVLWWFGQHYHGTVFCLSHYYPSWPNYCKGVRMWTGWVIMCIPRYRRYLRTTTQFSKATVPQFTQLKLFSRGLKSMKVDFDIFSGQQNHQIWTSLNH
jgi:hypothetical protein